jgi:hypothetical protein
MLPHLHDWEMFYSIVGTAAAALTGLQFVVMALSAGTAQIGGTDAVEAFASPNVVHFCAVLLIAALVVMPGPTSSLLATLLTIGGAAGVVYALIVMLRARRQTTYAPVLEDWLWHVALPLAAYAAVLISGIVLYSHTVAALYAVAGSTIALLLIAIHNAWDSAVYIATHARRRE